MINHSLNDIIVYPNPTDDQFKISLTVNEQENIFVYLANGYGKKLDLGHYFVPKGNTVLDFNINVLNLSPGLYYLVIESDSKTKRNSKLFIKR